MLTIVSTLQPEPRLVVPHSTCPSLSFSPPAHNFIIGPAVINTHTLRCKRSCPGSTKVLQSPKSKKYVWEPSNRVCGARGAAAHAWAPGLSTGRRLMPMPARSRRVSEQRRFDSRSTRGEYCGEGSCEEVVCVDRNLGSRRWWGEVTVVEIESLQLVRA